MLKPLLDKVLIKEDKVDTEAKVGGLIMPGTAAQKNYNTGTVLSVGNGAYEKGILVPNCVNGGEKVLYMKYSANCYRDEENSLVLIRNSDLLAIFDE
jgi:chaperonin GroES